MLSKDLAICIRAVDYSETSQIVSFFTRDTGKISVIAKGSKRPRSAFDGPIEIFSTGRIVFSHAPERKLATLTEFEPRPGRVSKYEMPGVRYELGLYALNCSYFAAELLNHLTDEYDPHPELFDDFAQFLQDTAEAPDRVTALALLIFFQLSLLKQVGVKPILNACANCKCRYGPGWSETYFSSSANGLVCRDCEDSFPDKIMLSAEAANILADLKLIAKADEKMLKEIERTLVYHFTELLHRPPRMAKHFTK